MSDTEPQTEETPTDEPQEAVDTNAPDETTEATEESAATESADDSTETTSDGSDDSVQTPEFPDLKPNGSTNGTPGDMNRLFDVHVTVAAELGRTSVPIQTLLGLTEGSVFELDRSISSPIELVAQGVPLGNGEVVVVDDSFAIRIKEIYANPS